MPGFVAINPIKPQEILTNSPFWPDMDLATVRAVAKLDGTIPDTRLRQALLIAMDSVNSELAAWQQQQQGQGYVQLADIPGLPLAGQHRLVMQYFQAVVCTATVDLLEQLRSYDSSGAGHQQADLLTPRMDEQRRAAHWAISAILGRTRSTVELI